MAETFRRGSSLHQADPATLRDVTIAHWDGLELVLRSGDRVIRGAVERRGGHVRVHFDGFVYDLEVAGHDHGTARDPDAPSDLYAPMTGTVVQVFSKEGDEVARGAPILVIEAMKMEHRIVAPAAAKILRLFVKAGDRVDVGADLVSLKLEEPE